MSSGKEKEPVRLSLVISAKLNARLEELASSGHISKSDVLKRAIALFDVAVDAKKNHKRLGILDQNKQLENKIVGLF